MRRAALEKVRSLHISDADKAFLLEAGLPEDASFDLSFDLSLDRITLRPSKATLIKLGRDYGGPICIDEGAGGAVVALEDGNNSEKCFLNSSVSQLAEFILLYDEIIGRESGGAGEEDEVYITKTSEALKKLKSGFRQSDPMAHKDNSWWGNVLDEIELTIS